MDEKRKIRIGQAFEYLRSIGQAHIQQDVANKMKIGKATVSRAFGGNEKYLTDKFIHRFNMTYDNMFNEEWLLEGKGEMLKSGINQTSHGDNSPNINCSDYNYSFASLDKALDEISEMRKALTDALSVNQKHTDRLLSIIELINNKQ